jgi:BirA family transcriptional regulator, biotin operon repressor / biotin---[acetyl-CoA-carboxylase] ligase
VNRADLLKALAAAPDGVSGAKLAQRFGLSRSAVWKAVENLRGEGLRIDAAAGRGYRLAQPLDPLDEAALRALLGLRIAARFNSIEVVWCIDSTSSELRRRQAAGDPSPRLLLAESQSAGRGRLGREWRSPVAANLYLSLGWRLARPASALGGLSLALGVAVAEALETLGVDDLGLKWPNDVLRHGRKLGGLLLELGGELGGPSDLVIGLGLNVRMPRDAADSIDQPWADLADLADSGRLPSRNALAAAVVGAMVAALDAYDHQGFAPFLPRFERLDALSGRMVAVREGDRRASGVALGVDAEGGLRVRHAEGERIHRGGEVSLR